jgi:hypothetical protein
LCLTESVKGAVSLKVVLATSAVRKAVNSVRKDFTLMRETVLHVLRKSQVVMSVDLLTYAPSAQVLT